VVGRVDSQRLEIATPEAPQTEETRTQMSSSIRRPLLILVWTGIGLGVVAGGLYLGYELRKRRLAKRTPYDSYSHAGEDRMFNSTEYGVGI